MMRGLAIVLILLLLTGTAAAEDGWVMCQPDSKVNIRERPNKHSTVVGFGYMGDKIRLDGKRQGAWLHCLISAEVNEGWIRADFISTDEPEDVGSGIFLVDKKNTRARFSATTKGKVRKTLKAGTEVDVFMVTPEWCVTSEGFIRTDCLAEVHR